VTRLNGPPPGHGRRAPVLPDQSLLAIEGWLPVGWRSGEDGAERRPQPGRCAPKARPLDP
jgi:hypothetical protein